MKAAVVIGPGKLELREVPKPVCGKNDLLLKIHRASICATDLMYFEARFSCPPYPFILGHECSGEVVEVGQNVQGFHEDDRLTFWGGGDFGGFAEYRTIRPGPRELFSGEEGMWYDWSQAVTKLDETISYEEGAILEVLCSGMRAIYASSLQPADKVVVLGMGAGGLLILQAARALGANAVIGIDREDFRLRKAQELGADAVYNSAKVDNRSVRENIRKTFGDVDIVFDALGNDLSTEKTVRDLGLELLHPQGKYAVYGTPSEDQKINVALITSKGIQTKAATFDARFFPMDKSQDLLEFSQRLVVNGTVKIKPLITQRIRLDQVAQGLKLCRDSKQEVVKIVLEIT
jgi:2-desacetyl-2-hydroxyethyl bacteriochlorophyllide A dehydrogenase